MNNSLLNSHALGTHFIMCQYPSTSTHDHIKPRGAKMSVRESNPGLSRFQRLQHCNNATHIHQWSFNKTCLKKDDWKGSLTLLSHLRWYYSKQQIQMDFYQSMTWRDPTTFHNLGIVQNQNQFAYGEIC